jgi:hypothetical protein
MGEGCETQRNLLGSDRDRGTPWSDRTDIEEQKDRPQRFGPDR